MTTQTTITMETCIERCEESHRICLETVQYCLQLGGKHAEPSHVRLLMDCAQICATSADFMIRGSDMHGYTCAACAAVCERCAQDCEQFTDDEQMQRCARACRDCAESCRQMASTAH